MSGRIELIIGPMFSGKTTELKRRIEREKIGGKKVVIIKHSLDNRANKFKDIHLHSGEILKADFVTKDLSEVDVSKYEVVGIDEGHFFSSLKIVEKWANNGKYIIIATLVSNAKRETFIHSWESPVLDLIPKCENIKTLSAVCVKCKGDAHFTKKIKRGIIEKFVIDVGGAEKYEAVCRNCYLSKPPLDHKNKKKKKME